MTGRNTRYHDDDDDDDKGNRQLPCGRRSVWQWYNKEEGKRKYSKDDPMNETRVVSNQVG